MPKHDTCAICKEYTKLSKEHVPPSAAFNDSMVIVRKINKWKSTAKVAWHDKKIDGGRIRYSICEKCNVSTGAWYGKEYVKLVKAMANYATPLLCNKKDILISVNNFYPLKAFKQILSIFCSTCGPELVSEHPQIQKLILDRRSTGSPGLINIYGYLCCPIIGRSTGIAQRTNLKSKNSTKVAEFSWWPAGWLLAFNDQKDLDMANISSWGHFRYNEAVNMTITMPCYWSASPYPMDFRSPEQVANERFVPQARFNWK